MLSIRKKYRHIGGLNNTALFYSVTISLLDIYKTHKRMPVPYFPGFLTVTFAR